MSEPGMAQFEVNQLEHHARTFATMRAQEVYAEFVDLALHQAGVSGMDPRWMKEVERTMERRLRALLANSLIEFTKMYTAELERRAKELQKIAENAAANMLTPPVIFPRKDGE
jgi:hypothetical protein